MHRPWHLIALSAFLGAVTPAVATNPDWHQPDRGDLPLAQRIWLGQVSKRLAAQGFDVRRIGPQAGGYAVEMIYRGAPAGPERAPNQ
jgi:hypothetical protein